MSRIYGGVQKSTIAFSPGQSRGVVCHVERRHAALRAIPAGSRRSEAAARTSPCRPTRLRPSRLAPYRAAPAVRSRSFCKSPIPGPGGGGSNSDGQAPVRIPCMCNDPQVGPLALDWPLQERVHPRIDTGAQLRHLALRDALDVHGLHQVVHLAGRHPLDPRLLDHRYKRLLGHAARLKERREVRTLAPLRGRQFQRAQPCVEGAWP